MAANSMSNMFCSFNHHSSKLPRPPVAILRPGETNLLLRLPSLHTPLPPNRASHSETLSFAHSPTLLPLRREHRAPPEAPRASHPLFPRRLRLFHRRGIRDTLQFNNLVSGSPRDIRHVHLFVPALASPRVLEDGTLLAPSMAIQVTVFANSGFSICVNFRHAIADGRAFHHFMKSWASLLWKLLDYLPRGTAEGKVGGRKWYFGGGECYWGEVRGLRGDLVKGFEWIISGRRRRELGRRSQHAVIIAGSPKLNAYETDFGWGRPKMSEILHADDPGSMWLSDCRDEERGIEVGLALSATQMKKFNAILEEQLRDIVADE
ncbi:Coumaroyl-CoA:anthocyanidin 3-O-glucoside-6''-O-coumaroyltransferase 1 [Spatholobus suberectus]|nr:Coumaroyl-CoA:anthocyanidin 3-O-glucoside-6''-O-coumaroyltransferase 1 [Spatholobus suberectus]